MPARSTTPLRVVEPSPAPVDPDVELAKLFALEAQLVAQLADCRRAMNDARARYGALHGFKILPRIETLRALLHRPQGRRP